MEKNRPAITRRLCDHFGTSRGSSAFAGGTGRPSYMIERRAVRTQTSVPMESQLKRSCADGIRRFVSSADIIICSDRIVQMDRKGGNEK